MWFCLRRFVRCRGSVVPRDDLEETGLAQEEVNGLKVLPRLRQNHFQRGMTPCLRRVPLGAPNTFHIFRAQHFLHWFYIGFTLVLHGIPHTTPVASIFVALTAIGAFGSWEGMLWLTSWNPMEFHERIPWIPWSRWITWTMTWTIRYIEIHT